MSSIITPSDLNAYTQKTLATAVAKQAVDAVNAYIERVTHRCWGDSVTVKEVCDYAPRIWLRHQDVTAISSVKFGTSAGTRLTLKATGTTSTALDA
jgi:hypothetical protein